MKNPITVFSDQSERVNYNFPELPVVYAKPGDLLAFGYEAMCHWHADLEFILMYSGSMDYFVNGKVVRINEGEGIFVNSRRLHYGFSKEKKDCSYLCVLVNPSVFPKSFPASDSYLHTKFNWNATDYLILHPDIPAEKRVLRSVQALYESMSMDDANPLLLVAQGCQICAGAGELVPDTTEEKGANQEQIEFLNMTSFIHSNFAEKISLDDIAAAGAMCRSKCCQLFQQRLKQSPNNYLTQYRIAKSCELLKNTNLSIGEIALQCGFQNASYYTSVFQKLTGELPKQYRQRNR